MIFNKVDCIGDWNPQLLREIKGRWQVRTVAVAIAISLLSYLLMFLYGLSQLNRLTKYVTKFDTSAYYNINAIFCQMADIRRGSQQQFDQLQEQYRHLQNQFYHYSSPANFDSEKIHQLKGQLEGVNEKIRYFQNIRNPYSCPPEAINIPLWWQYLYSHMFAWLSLIVLLGMLVMGTYMLISDLTREERRGTLNFIRFSPQSAQSILCGKLLGVPIFLYFTAALTVPLHLWLGLSAQIPLLEIISFWLVLIVSCIFFYSAALLFSLSSSFLGGFQSWLGSGAVLILLWIANFKPIDFSPLDWWNLFSPSVLLPYLVNRTGSDYTDFPFNLGVIQGWKWFHLPVGATGVSIIIFALLNYALWTGWIWQALNRRFDNPHATLFSKRQSYWLVGCLEVVLLGFALESTNSYSDLTFSIVTNLVWIAGFNIVLFGGLIAVLSPHRQTLQDWARYPNTKATKREKIGRMQDLVWGEKSPNTVAIAINLAIATTPFLVLVFLWPTDYLDKIKALLGIGFFISLTMIFATIAQLMLMRKTPKRSLWTSGTLVALFALPPIILLVMGIEPQSHPNIWLFSTFPWAGIEHATTTTIFLQMLSQFIILGLLNLKLMRQLRRAGESGTKALLT